MTGCSSTSPVKTEAETSPSAASVAKETPALKITLDCGSCDVKSSVPALIVNGYNAAAKQAGSKVTPNKIAQVSIKEYSARSDGARFLAGAFAGKDEIKAVISYGGKIHSVEDYYRNAWQGIDSLATKIGEMTYSEINK